MTETCVIVPSDALAVHRLLLDVLLIGEMVVVYPAIALFPLKGPIFEHLPEPPRNFDRLTFCHA